MKIKKHDYIILENRLRLFINSTGKSLNEWKQIYKEQGLSGERLRWDLLWGSKIKIGDGVGIKGDLNLYEYMNDNHIDTALRKITDMKK